MKSNKMIGWIALFIVCYIPASYLLMFGMVAHTIFTDGANGQFTGDDRFGIAIAPLTTFGFLLFGMGTWSEGFRDGNLVWWFLSTLMLVWAACFWLTRRALRHWIAAARAADAKESI